VRLQQRNQLGLAFIIAAIAGAPNKCVDLHARIALEQPRQRTRARLSSAHLLEESVAESLQHPMLAWDTTYRILTKDT
jgi:hypothetical protein